MTDPTQKPRIALMGEFSAGKSTLANLLFGEDVSPVKVTATQMPPIWYTGGAPDVFEMDADGSLRQLHDADLEEGAHQSAAALKVSLEAEVLEFCDLIDMPGTSDPNLAMSVWENMLSRVDGVIWCTPATQAWRQSEAALWEEIAHDFEGRALLLVTRMDQVASDLDRRRVLARVGREVDGLFRGVHGVSLTRALVARGDEAALEACGVGPFLDAFMEMVGDIARAGPRTGPRTGPGATAGVAAE